MKVYIAGPIQTDLKYREKFMCAEVKMKQCGYEVVNPAKNKCESYEEYIDTGLRQLMECDTIYLLKGWETSRGASLEAHYAKVKGLRIFEQTAKLRACPVCGKMTMEKDIFGEWEKCEWCGSKYARATRGYIYIQE